MVDPTLPLPGLSAVDGKSVVARFDGGRLSSDGGVLALREVARRLKVAERLAACLADPRDPTRTVHSLDDIIGFRLLAIAAGCEDGNDADRLRSDPLFKMALDRRPSQRDLCSQSTVSRLENLPDLRALASTSTLRRHVTTLETSTGARFEAAPGPDKVRRFKEFYDGAATWSRVRRIVARLEAGPQGVDTRFIVTNLHQGRGRALYEEVYCRRGQAENHIKTWKAHLAADRTSCSAATANQFRLFLHAGAYWLLWSLRALMPKRSRWRVAQFDPLRGRLVKIAARVEELKTRITVHLPTSAPDQAIIHLVLGRLPRLIC
ncbi:MAG TPA: transposase [Azospirillaceae bacterium]|nr:transposase [Azospirillaceae bacterium]